MSSAQVKGACHRGSLERVLPRVYRVTSVPEAWEQRPMAGTLWGRPITVASDLTAAFLHDVLPRGLEKVHLTSDHPLHGRPGFSVRLCRLLPADLAVVRGIPCTSISRTLVDIARTTEQDKVEAALDAALRTGQVLLADLEDFVEEAARRKVRGSARLRPLLEVRGDEDALSESEFESRFGRLMRRGDLPMGERQTAREGVRKGRIDIFYPEQKLVIELDGRKWHSARREKSATSDTTTN